MKNWRIIFIFVFLLVLSAQFVLSSVFLNEVELNPSGSDVDNQWIEVFNSGASQNLSGWYLNDMNGNNFYFQNVTINSNNFLSLNLTNYTLSDSNENISLYNKLNVLQDEVLNLSDLDDDNKTWQRLPDGTGDFIFKNSTKGVSNYVTSINDKTHFPSCLVKGEEVVLNANVTGFCVNEVIFSVFTNSGQVNITGNDLGNGNYTAVVNSSLLNAYNNVSWTVYAKDCFNQTVRNGDEYFYLNNRTTLTVVPSNPNGLNGWYVTEPIFLLENGDSNSIFYRWNGNYFTYTGLFDLDDGTPNNGNVTGGVHVLKYWSNFSCKTENDNSQTFKFDFLTPFITDLTPGDGEIIDDVNPEISAYLDEIYQSNSGINTSTLLMILDNSSVSFINQSFGLDAKVKYNAENLSEGIHTIKVGGMDNAGHYTELEWDFEINLSTLAINISINSPVNELYENRNVPINVTLDKEADYIKYINYDDKKPGWKILCKDCKDYGKTSTKTKRFLEGENNLSFMAIDSFGREFSENVSIFIDSIAPKIKEVEPKTGYIDSNFNINIIEDNPTNMSIFYGNGTINMGSDVNLSECTNVKSVKYCNGFIDLSEFNGQEIEYYVNLTDIMNRTVKSKINKVMVDTVNPVINSVDFTNIGRRVELRINVSELNLEEVNYIDLEDRTPKERRLCTKLTNNMCVKVLSFRPGVHNLTINAVDQAGNNAFVDDVIFNIA
ncbi:lamin tail domain-containing protein [Candidatus Pacearchaeota archaeon]|nr:lamin tail domain-containing protein [Candidatus Pacearchaeota archaeon]